MLDLVLAAGLALGLWRGLTTGALLQIVGTLGWVVAFIGATSLMGPIGDAAAASLGVSGRVAPLVGFVVVFGVIVAAMTVAAHGARKVPGARWATVARESSASAPPPPGCGMI